jgi:hypothetical protein
MMIMNSTLDRKLIIIPVLISFLVALLLLYKFSYPISWDVYYHIHMAELYLNNGLVFWDYQTVAPTGRLIMYPPLFHFILGFFAKLFNISVFDASLIAQPLFAFILMFAITFVAYRLSDDNVMVDLCTGFIAMMSFATFNRAVICTPATLAIACMMFCLLFYYEAFKEDNLRKILYSAIFFALVSNLHMATAIITLGVLGLYSLYLIISCKVNWRYIIVYVILAVLLSAPWWLYISLNYQMVFNSIAGSYLRIDEFLIKYYGIIPSLFTFAGFYSLYRNWSDKTVFLGIWSLSIVALSQVPILGVDTVSIRLFEVSAYPLILIAGIGVYEVLNRISKVNLRYLVLALVILYSIFASVAYVDSYTPDLLDDDDCNETVLPDAFHMVFDPIGSILRPSIISDRYGSSMLAHSRYDMTRYMIKNNISGIVVSQDAIMDTIIVSSTNASVIYGGFTESIPEYVVDPVHIVNSQASLGELDELGIRYLLIRKDTPIATYAEVEYENDDYKLCRIVLK